MIPTFAEWLSKLSEAQVSVYSTQPQAQQGNAINVITARSNEVLSMLQQASQAQDPKRALGYLNMSIQANSEVPQRLQQIMQANRGATPTIMNTLGSANLISVQNPFMNKLLVSLQSGQLRPEQISQQIQQLTAAYSQFMTAWQQLKPQLYQQAGVATNAA